MQSRQVRVNLGKRSYDILIGQRSGFSDFVSERCKGRKAVVITDENVRPHAERCLADLRNGGFDAASVVRPAGEKQKSLGVAAEIYDQFVEFQADRRTVVVAVGGGVVGDLAGFVASTFNRGLPLLMVPTTLLAMVDSSVGGKVAVNHPRGKNLIGTFHQPAGVWIDLTMLATLPEREYRSGLAEVVKYGMILDPDFFAYLENNTQKILDRDQSALAHILDRCCRLKADVVERDEREETGQRAVLNYGHTFAHAFETAADYGAWLHGEAVAAGMICASRLAERCGLITGDLTQRQLALLGAFGLPVKAEPWPTDQLIATMRSDKKAIAGKMRFILPRRLGEVDLFADISEADVRAILDSQVG